MIETKDIKKTLDIIVQKIDSILKEKEYVVMGFAGGRSIRKFSESLKAEKRIDWKKIHIFMVDERLVRITHDESNFRLVEESLLKFVDIPKQNVHPFILKNLPDYGLGRYEEEFKKFGGKFDIAIFGVGEDGHIGALYPNGSIRNDAESFMLLHDSPKPPKDRMTLSRKLALKTGLGVFLFIGEGKKEAFGKFKDIKINTEGCPVKIAYDLDKAVIFEDLR